MLENLLKYLETLRITSIIILCIVSTFIFIPKMSALTINFHSLILNSFSDSKSFRLNSGEMNNLSEEIYIPPNYGAPDSQHGSGTR